jgi:serine-type D-Ala-D-Ala carboxypeptidase/endopeptidase (penicillin-binding protein 4)
VAGYVQGQSGQRYTLVAVLHHPNAHQARAALDQLLEWTVRDTASTPKAEQPDRAKHRSLRSSR